MVSTVSQIDRYRAEYHIPWADSIPEKVQSDKVVEPTSPMTKNLGNSSYMASQPATPSLSMAMQPFSSYSVDYDLTDPDSPVHKAQMATWFWNPQYGTAHQLNIPNLRRWSRLEAVQICINKLIRRISRLDWDIVFKDKDITDKERAMLEPQRQDIINLFKMCNNRKESISDVTSQMLRDIYTIDGGVITKIFNRRGDLVGLTANDAGTFVKNFDRYGMPPTIDNHLPDGRRIPAYYQYSIINPAKTPQPFYDEEIVYFMQNPQSFSIYGLSPVDVLKERTLKYLFRSGKWNADFFEKNMMPAAIINTKGMNEPNRRKAMQFWNTKVKGSDHKVQFVDGELSVNTLQLSNKDMEFIAGSKFFMNYTAEIYGLNPNAVGITDSVGSKNVSQNQSEQVNIDAIQPMLEMMERNISHQILPHFFSAPEKDTEGNMVNVITKDEVFDTPFEYKYILTDTTEEQRKFNNLIIELQNGVLSKDEYRHEAGREPLEDDDDDDDEKDETANPETDTDNEDVDSQDKKKNKALADEPAIGSPAGLSDTKAVVDTSKTVATVSQFEREYMQAYANLDRANRNDVDMILSGTDRDRLGGDFKDINKDMDKTFDTNLMAATAVVSGLIGSIFASAYDNVESMSKLDINIPATIESNTIKSNIQMTNIDLLKNVSEDQRKNIIQTLQNGIDNSKSIPQIVKDLKPVIDSRKRAETISRTEVLKTFGKAQDQAAEDSGLFKYKVWVTAEDERVRCTHRPMDGQIRKLDQSFDLPSCGTVPAEKMNIPRTGSASNSINCRCTVNYYTTLEEAEKDTTKSIDYLALIEKQEAELDILMDKDNRLKTDDLNLIIKDRELELRLKEKVINDKKADLIKRLEAELDG